jgi:hypothetical protein
MAGHTRRIAAMHGGWLAGRRGSPEICGRWLAINAAGQHCEPHGWPHSLDGWPGRSHGWPSGAHGQPELADGRK